MVNKLIKFIKKNFTLLLLSVVFKTMVSMFIWDNYIKTREDVATWWPNGSANMVVYHKMGKIGKQYSKLIYYWKDGRIVYMKKKNSNSEFIYECYYYPNGQKAAAASYTNHVIGRDENLFVDIKVLQWRSDGKLMHDEKFVGSYVGKNIDFDGHPNSNAYIEQFIEK